MVLIPVPTGCQLLRLHHLRQTTYNLQYNASVLIRAHLEIEQLRQGMTECLGKSRCQDVRCSPCSWGFSTHSIGKNWKYKMMPKLSSKTVRWRHNEPERRWWPSREVSVQDYRSTLLEFIPPLTCLELWVRVLLVHRIDRTLIGCRKEI